MCFMNNIAVSEVIPFNINNIIYYFNLLGCRVLEGGILITVIEDVNLVLVYFKKLVVLLV